MTDKKKADLKGEDDSPSAATGSAACIVIDPSDFIYADSELIAFYKCKNCDAVEIQSDFEYCPMCGIKITFDK